MLEKLKDGLVTFSQDVIHNRNFSVTQLNES